VDPVLRPKIALHGKDEEKHGRMFDSLLRRRGLEAVEVPLEANYTLLLENAGIGLSHERLREDRTLSDEDLLKYLAHSRVTEQRAAEEVATQKRLFTEHPDLQKALRVISEDEENHLAYCHEELLRFVEMGHGPAIRRMLRRYALAEIATYRRVSLTVVERMGEVLGWAPLKRATLRLGIHAVWLYERIWGWRRMARLRVPERRNAMGSAHTAEAIGPDPAAGAV
jgi:hypothetical protein